MRPPFRLPPLILASASPRRAELLHELGLEFTVFPSQSPEVEHDQLTGAEIAQVNAYRKARQVSKKFPDALVLGADTVVCAGLKLFGKPSSREDAARMLLELQGRLHQVITAVCLLHLRAHAQEMFSESTTVKFRSLTAQEVQDYLALVDPLDKAGAYAIQEHGSRIVESIQGSRSNVVGLPLEALREHLERWPGF